MKYLVLLIPFLSFAQVDDKAYREKYNLLEEQQLSLSTEHFQKLVEWALVLRSQTLDFHHKYETAKKKGEPLTGAQVESIARGLRKHLELRESLFKLVDDFSLAYFNSDKRTLLNEKNKLKSTIIAFSAALVLYDNYALSTIHISTDDHLRRLVNKANKAYNVPKNALKEMTESYHSVSNRNAIRSVYEYTNKNKAKWNELAKTDPQMAYLKALFTQSPSCQKIDKDSQARDYARYVGLLAQHGEDRVSKINKKSSHFISMAFGNGMGLVQTRQGKLYGKREVNKALLSQLKPLDILLEKTPFRLTDKFIPGHFGHVAVWLGTEEELKRMGMWEDPFIKPHQKAISSGHCVLEALRTGVELNSLSHFLNVDDVAILRLKEWPEGERKAALRRSLQHVGKEYDFNFDVETIDRIVCSEIVYHIFTHLKWPTERTLGRATISPDNVAVKALKKGEFEVVDLYLKGKKIKSKKMIRKYNGLLVKKKSSFLKIPSIIKSSIKTINLFQ